MVVEKKTFILSKGGTDVSVSMCSKEDNLLQTLWQEVDFLPALELKEEETERQQLDGRQNTDRIRQECSKPLWPSKDQIFVFFYLFILK